MNKITTIGLDTAKNVFHLVGCDHRGKIILKKQLRRSQLLPFFAKLPPCQVGLEACSASHHWGRELRQLGHNPCLIAAQHVKAYLRGNKHDFNDAAAIAEAVVRPEMRFVPIKTVEQQDQILLVQLRQRQIDARTRQCNRIRAMLSERGVCLGKGIRVLRRAIPILLENTDGRFGGTFLHCLRQEAEALRGLDDAIKLSDQEIQHAYQENEAYQRLLSIPGFGPIVASAYLSQMGSGEAFTKGRDVSASLGLVPRQHSSAGRAQLMGISKRGDPRMRSLLVHGARAVISRLGDKQDRLSCWLRTLVHRVGVNKATVAYANKMTRIAWAVLRYESAYDPRRAVGHPNMLANA